jgi:hypothetical protein
MAAAASLPLPSSPDSMSPATALKRAWLSWLVMLVIPFLFFLIVIWYLIWPGRDTQASSIRQIWFLAASLYIILIVPAALFWRSHVFKAYWAGEPVPPRQYLTGMLTVWVALEVGGLFSLVGCLVSRSLLPCLLPALAAFMFFFILWPTGHAMTRPVGNTDDHAIYEEPK